MDIDSIPGFIRDVEERERLLLAQGRHEVDFPRDNGMRFHNGNLPLHENGMQIHAYNGDEVVYSKTYYSIGGGLSSMKNTGQDAANEVSVPYPFKSATELLAYCNETGYSLSGLAMQNELALHSKKEIDEYFAHVWPNHAGMYRSRDEHRRRTARPAARAASCVCPAPDAGFQR